MSRIVTFYSYKGGVGRTLALANIGILLARRGKRVLLVDWDLEAPGLERYFRDYLPSVPSAGRGLIYLLHKASGAGHADWRTHVQQIKFRTENPSPTTSFGLSFISSGVGSQDYAERVRAFSWSHFVEEMDGGPILERWRNEWKDEFDFVLLDSRTGITDTGGICTILLPDFLVLVFTANAQSFEGAVAIAQSAQQGRQQLAVPRPPLMILPLLSRFDPKEEVKLADEWLARLATDLKPFFDDWLPKQFHALQILEVTKIPYVALFSFGEPLPVFSHSLTEPQLPGFYLENVTRLLATDFRDAEQIIDRTGATLEDIDFRVRSLVQRTPEQLNHPRVFISYSHDSPEHAARVLALAKALRTDGIDTRLDQFETVPAQGWTSWCAQQFLTADFVLLVCTETFRRRFLGLDEFGRRRGVIFEGKIIENTLYYAEVRAGIIPVLFSSADEAHIPETVKEASWILLDGAELDPGYGLLLRRLTGGRLFPPLENPVPVPDSGAPDDASIPTEEAWKDSERITLTIDRIRRTENYRERRSVQRFQTVKWALAALALVIVASFFFFQRSAEKIVADPTVLRVKLEEKIDQSFEEKRAALVAQHAKPEELDQLYQWRDQVKGRLDEAVRFVAGESESTIVKQATGILQERGVDAALDYLQTTLLEAQKHQKEQARQLAKAALLKADIYETRLDFNDTRQALEQAVVLDYYWWKPHHRLGVLLLRLAQWKAAETELREADKFAEKNEDRAAVLNKLAEVMLNTNRLAEAEPLMQQALAIDERIYGPEHPNVARDLNSLAQLFQDTNRLAEAEPLMRRALAIDVRLLGPEHQDVAIRLNNLARLLRDTNRLAEAEPLMMRALAITEKSFGVENPEASNALNNLAQLLQDTNRFAEAEPLMRRALAIDEKSFGPDHPTVARSLNNLAQLLQITNRLAEAEPLMRRALAIDEKSFGPDHPKVAIRLNNLAQLLQATDRLADAEQLMRQAVLIFMKFTHETGHLHPYLRRAVDNYRDLLKGAKLPQDQIDTRLATMGREAGFDENGFRKLLERMRE